MKNNVLVDAVSLKKLCKVGSSFSLHFSDVCDSLVLIDGMLLCFDRLGGSFLQVESRATFVIDSAPVFDLMRNGEVDSEFVEFIDDGTINLSLKGISLCLGRRELQEFVVPYETLFKVSTLHWIDFPKEFLDGLIFSSSFMSKDVTTEFGSVWYIAEEAVLIATDGKRAGLFTLETPFSTNNLLFPGSIISLIKDVSPVKYCLVDDLLFLLDEVGMVSFFRISLLENSEKALFLLDLFYQASVVDTEDGSVYITEEMLSVISLFSFVAEEDLVEFTFTENQCCVLIHTKSGRITKVIDGAFVPGSFTFDNGSVKILGSLFPSGFRLFLHEGKSVVSVNDGGTLCLFAERS